MVTLKNENKQTKKNTSSCSANVQSERFANRTVRTVKTNHLFQSDACVALVHFHREFSPNSLNLEANKRNTTSEHPKRKRLKPRHKKTRGTSDPARTHGEVLPYGLHLLTGVEVVLVGLPVGFHHLQRLSQDLRGYMKNTVMIFSSETFLDATETPDLRLDCVPSGELTGTGRTVEGSGAQVSLR